MVKTTLYFESVVLIVLFMLLGRRMPEVLDVTFSAADSVSTS